MYINKLFPFIDQAAFIRNVEETVPVGSIYCPIDFGPDAQTESGVVKVSHRAFKAYRVLPCGTLVMNESEDVLSRVLVAREYGPEVRLNIIEVDYLPVAKRITVDTVSGKLTASMQVMDAFQSEEVATDVFINAAGNGTQVVPELLVGVSIPRTPSVDFGSWANSFDTSAVKESADMLADLIADKKAGKSFAPKVVGAQTDAVYDWLDSYFRLPENADMKSGGREVVPLLIGPTAVFKSATVKELCKKYDYRMVDFRVSFTSRLDYSGLFQIGEVDGEKFSYACPMEELVTCSDGFREYCRKAYDKVSEILTRGYLEDNKVSNGLEEDSVRHELTDEQRKRLQGLLEQYKNYMRTPVLFFDEITRTKDNGVNGILVQLLNQKRFNNMTLNGCKFVAATNLNLVTDARHAQLKDDLDDMYDVNTDLDVAYSNRFMPLKVFPDDVKGRWFEWAAGTKQRGTRTVQNIHPLIIEFLTDKAPHMVYNDTPVLDAIEAGKSDNETRSQTFPNYRTWEMLSDYMHSIDEDYESRKADDKDAVPEYREKIMFGLISDWAGKEFRDFIRTKGYRSFDEVHGKKPDDVGDFLGSTLEAGVPALLIGPSSLGKTSRVHAYMKGVERRTGLKPVLINVNLASMDTVDLMGMPVKQTLVDYVSGGDLDRLGLGSVGRELSSVVRDVSSNISYGMVDSLTLRAPDMTIKERFQTALKEGREVILFFDECNRCFTADTKVRLLDGRVLSMKEIADEFGTDKEFWVYSCDAQGNFVPGKAVSLGVTRKNAQLVEVTFDNGKTVKCTPDHPFMLRDGTYRKASELSEGDSLSASYFRYKAGRELISTRGSSYDFTHRLVGDTIHPGYLAEGLVCHHDDRDILNNEPGNLRVITAAEHMREHYDEKSAWKLNPTEKQLKSMQDNMYKNFMANLDKREAHRLATMRDAGVAAAWAQANIQGHNTAEFVAEQSDRCKAQWGSGQFDKIDRQAALKKNRTTALVSFLVKLIEMGKDVTPENYEALRVENTGRGKVAYKATKLSSLAESTNFNSIQEAIDTAYSLVTAPVNHSVKSVRYLSTVEDVYDLNVETYHNFLVDLGDGSGVYVHNCKNPVVMSAMFTCISDYEFCHISFKAQKDRVKIVAACNMGFDDMDPDAGDYSGAGSLDPALAARFSIFWKKKYDGNDVQSWIEFMEDQKKEGNIDSTLIDFFKTLPTDDAIRLIASVERRTIENAEPSTRTLFQMSKDIRSMRGHATDSGYQSSLYNGKIIFDDMMKQEFQQIDGVRQDTMTSREFYAQGVHDFLEKVLAYASKWEPALTGGKIDMGRGRVMSATDIMDSLEKIYQTLSGYLLRPLTAEERENMVLYADTALDLADACKRLDQRASDKRKNWFTMYAGEELASVFTDYFNSVFGTGQDEDITIEMLSDDSLIDPFMKKKKAEMARFQGNTDKMIDAMLDLMREFLSVHGTTLPARNYAKLVDNISRILPTSDNMATLLRRSDKTVEGIFTKGEETGDAWIASVLACYPSAITTKDIEGMRARMSSRGSQAASSGKKRSRIL